MKDLQGIIEADIDLKIEATGGKPRHKKSIYQYELDAVNKLKETFERHANSLPGH